jgi:hypothetical protein
MDNKLLFEKYRNHPMFQATLAIWIVAGVVKLAVWGFEFGQWLHIK